jgi:superfamily II DNA or RNA helicase
MLYENLRPLQQQAISLLRQSWKQHKTHLINASCGFGKTALASYLCQAFAAAGQKTLFVAPYVTLVDQTYTRFSQYGHNDLGVIWQNDVRTNPMASVQIASADTLIRRAFPDDVKVLIVDECDLKRKTILEIMKKPDLKTIGLTATPYAKWLGVHYQNFIKPVTTRELIDQGLLVPFEISAPYRPDLSGVKVKRSYDGEVDFVEDQIAAIMGEAKIAGNILQNWLVHGQNEPTIGFAPNVSTANAYAAEFRAAGVATEVVTADTPIEERKVIYARFAEGIVRVLWNVGVLGAGFDSDVRCIIWAKPTKSERTWVQGVLRGSRTAKEKTHCKLFDHSGTYYRLGCPTEIEYFELHDGSDGMEEARKAVKEKREKATEGKTCSQCKRIKEPGEYVCRRCGHKPLAGEITVEVDESIGLQSVGKGKVKKATQEEKELFYSEILGYRKERASSGKMYSDGWVANIYRKRFGVWPKGLGKTARPASPTTRSFIKATQIAFAKGKARATA